MLTPEDLIVMTREPITKVASENNPYHDNGCPVCGEHAVDSCRCMGPHKAADLQAGHGLKCANGHRWSREKVAEEIVQEQHTPLRKAVDTVTDGAKAVGGALVAGVQGIQSLDNKAPVRTI